MKLSLRLNKIAQELWIGICTTVCAVLLYCICPFKNTAENGFLTVSGLECQPNFSFRFPVIAQSGNNRLGETSRSAPPGTAALKFIAKHFELVRDF